MTALIDMTQPIPGAPHFSWWELTVTEHRSFVEANRQVPVAFQPAAEALARLIEQVRGYWGKPVMVHSAFRSFGLNAAIRGAKTSQHMKFEAVDFHIVGVSLLEVFNRIKSERIPVGQCLLEGPDPSAGLASWVHLSLGHPFRAEERSNEFMYYSTRSGKYTKVG